MPETTRGEEGRVSSSLGRGAAMYFQYTNICFFFFFSTKVMVWVTRAILRWVLRFLQKGPFLEAVLQHHLVGPCEPRAAKGAVLLVANGRSAASRGARTMRPSANRALSTAHQPSARALEDVNTP